MTYPKTSRRFQVVFTITYRRKVSEVKVLGYGQLRPSGLVFQKKVEQSDVNQEDDRDVTSMR